MSTDVKRIGALEIAATPRVAGRRARILAMAVVFFAALGVRLLYAPDAFAALYGAEQERYRIAAFYHEAAAEIAEGDGRMAFPSHVEPGETLLVGYPPGYFLFMAAIYRVTSDSMAAVLLAQCLVDSFSCVLLVLLGEALFSTRAGFLAGLAMAISPQLAALSLALKPDTITIAPVLGAMLLVARATAASKLRPWIAAGLLLGVACWMRQNALLLAPALALAAFLLGGARANWRGAIAMSVACVALVAPITIRNALLFGRAVPVTVGSGFALLSGLARDDVDDRYDLPLFAYNFSVDEATARGLEPDYYFVTYDRFQAGRARKLDTKHTVLSVFAVDGIERDAERRREALRLIANDPVYFARIYAIRVERLLGYTNQYRSVPLDAAPATSGYASREFYTTVDPRLGLWRYYAERGRFYDAVRPFVAALQRPFTTPIVLALALAGFCVVAIASPRRALFLLVPVVYYVGLQSLMWAEFRHTLPIHASIFIFVAAGASIAVDRARAALRGRLGRGGQPRSAV